MGKLNVDMKALKREIAKLNKTGILENPVDASGETKDIVEKFCDAVEQALDKDAETLKKSRSIVETYNDLVDQLDKMSKESEVDPEAEEKVEKKTIKKKTIKGKKSKDKKEKETLATVGGGKKKAEKVKEVKKQGIGDYVMGNLINDKNFCELSNDKIVELVKKKFPGCNTKVTNISWYRGKLKKEGKI